MPSKLTSAEEVFQHAAECPEPRAVSPASAPPDVGSQDVAEASLEVVLAKNVSYTDIVRAQEVEGSLQGRSSLEDVGEVAAIVTNAIMAVVKPDEAFIDVVACTDTVPEPTDVGELETAAADQDKAREEVIHEARAKAVTEVASVSAKVLERLSPSASTPADIQESLRMEALSVEAAPAAQGGQVIEDVGSCTYIPLATEAEEAAPALPLVGQWGVQEDADQDEPSMLLPAMTAETSVTEEGADLRGGASLSTWRSSQQTADLGGDEEEDDFSYGLEATAAYSLDFDAGQDESSVAFDNEACTIEAALEPGKEAAGVDLWREDDDERYAEEYNDDDFIFEDDGKSLKSDVDAEADGEEEYAEDDFVDEEQDTPRSPPSSSQATTGSKALPPKPPSRVSPFKGLDAESGGSEYEVDNTFEDESEGDD
jgi:hypothetical protein